MAVPSPNSPWLFSPHAHTVPLDFNARVCFQPAEMAVHSWPGYVAGEDLYTEVVAAILELVEERTEAADLLRGRTFARRLQ